MNSANIGFRMLITIIIIVGSVVPGAAGGQALAMEGIIYVDTDASGANNGTSWDDAFTILQPALETAVSGDQIWVAAGIRPTLEFTPGEPRTATFQMKNGVEIYGGFDPSVGDVDWEDRDWVSNQTVLSGDIGVAGNAGDNSYHVFYHPVGTSLDSSAILDGFRIVVGYANGSSNHNSGGGMYNNGSSPTVSNCTFEGNIANYAGGGMYNLYSSPTLSNIKFGGNSADYGGGMHNFPSSSSPILTDCTFQDNSADYGGGMYNEEHSSPTLINCMFLGNSASHTGGGMYNSEYSAPTLTNCTFDGNSAIYGGGMNNSEYSSPTLTNCTFDGNSATYGGGMNNFYYSWPTLTNCTFTGNSASYRAGGMQNDEYSSPSLAYCTFSGNSADYDGGGIHNGGYSSPTLTNCTFAGNSASRDGGGMNNDYNSSPSLVNCTFAGNSAMSGGGMNNISASSPTLINCIFQNNSATSGGGGMVNNSAASSLLINCTFTGNSAPSGSGMYNNYSSPTLVNTILWADSPEEIFNDYESWPIITYSDVQGGYEGNGNIDADPLFVDAGNGDLHLELGSPCIDVGNNTVPNLPPFDFEGDDRKLDGNNDGIATADMGVDELQPLFTVTAITGDDPDPSRTGEPFTVTFEVTSTFGVPTGVVTVTVSDSPASCSATLADGLGGCSLIIDTPGNSTLTASYGGAVGFAPSSDNEDHTVVESATITIITGDDPDPSRAGEPFTVTFEVTSTFGVPTGVVTVTVSDSPASCSATLADGLGSCSLIIDTPGNYTLTASYGGAVSFAPSSDNEDHTVVESATITIITGDDPDPSRAGELFTVTFEVTSTFGVPTGVVTVTVSDSPASCSATLADGLGSCSLIIDTSGNYTLTASYGGAVSYVSSSDNELHIVVNASIWLYLPLVSK